MPITHFLHSSLSLLAFCGPIVLVPFQALFATSDLPLVDLMACSVSVVTGCLNPGTPDNGRRLGNDFRIGRTVFYECIEGYRLQGSSARRCGQDGVWTGSLPSCVGRSRLSPHPHG